MVDYYDEDAVTSVLDLEALLPVIEDAFIAQHEGRVERPPRPHYPIGVGREPAPTEPTGTGLCMPAYIHGSPYAVTKLATVFEGNTAKNLPTVSAQILVHDADDGQARALLAATAITNARTGCIGGLGAQKLASDPVSLAVFGAGTQARWQTRAIDAATDLESVSIYAPSDSRERCAQELDGQLDAPVSAVSSPKAALEEATVIVTATTATEPVFDGRDLNPGTLVIAVGAYTATMRELDDHTIERAHTVYADVPEEAIETGDLRDHTTLEPVPFGECCLEGATAATDDGDITVLKSVGTAVLDAATVAFVLERL